MGCRTALDASDNSSTEGEGRAFIAVDADEAARVDLNNAEVVGAVGVGRRRRHDQA